jgi:hypothetical protein
MSRTAMVESSSARFVCDAPAFRESGMTLCPGLLKAGEPEHCNRQLARLLPPERKNDA